MALVKTLRGRQSLRQSLFDWQERYLYYDGREKIGYHSNLCFDYTNLLFLERGKRPLWIDPRGAIAPWELWAEHGAAFLHWWTRNHPGTRPFP